MSNQVNDQIADRVIMEVSELSRVEVFKELLVHKELDELFQAFNANGTIESDEDIARDLLIEIKFNEAMERPGPHG
tara:strand:+ start:274 stop:501 length:228 start_codon:yes stop_codon:yes gene_type:complete